MTRFNPFDTPDKSISDSQSGIAQFDRLMHQARPKVIHSPVTHPFEFTAQKVTYLNVIAILMEDTVDPWEK